uniref:Uncharacterized protein n=1 Tax=Oryza punctata TaxID=4537 RepID=A0A0E0MNA7_ORYPU
MKLYAALLSLSAAIFQKLVSDDKDLAELTDKISPGGTALSFAGKLKEMVEGNSEQATANCLTMLKITTRMIISLINLDGVKVGADLESLMHSLFKASEKMLELEGFMMYRKHESCQHSRFPRERSTGASGEEEAGRKHGNYTRSINGDQLIE